MYLQLAESAEPSNPFIFIPDVSGQSKGMWVREDYFDSLTDAEFKEMMYTLAPFQPEAGAGPMGEDFFLSDRASRRAKRREKDSKKAEKKRAKSERKTANKERRAETIKNIVGTFGGVVSSVFGKGKPEGGEDTSAPEPDSGSDEGTPIWKNPLFWVGTGIVVGGGIYLATRKR